MNAREKIWKNKEWSQWNSLVAQGSAPVLDDQSFSLRSAKRGCVTYAALFAGLLVNCGLVLAAEIVGTQGGDTLTGSTNDDVIFVGPKQGLLEVLTSQQTFAAGNGETVPAYSRDGSVLYYSLSTWGDVPTYKFITATRSTTVAGVGAEPKSSADGRAFATQTTLQGINLYDPTGTRRYMGGSYEHVSWVSNDGLKVSFASGASLLLWNAATGQVRRIDTNSANQISNAGSWWAMLSADARYVVFSSAGTNLVTNDTNGKRDVFLKDLQSGAITRISNAVGGGQANGDSGGYGSGGGGGRNRGLDASEDLRVIAYQSRASNLVSVDGNGSTSDIFLQDLTTGARSLVSKTYNGLPANGDSTNPAVSSDGRFVVFDSSATNLVANDTNGESDTFVVDTLWKTITRVNVSITGQQANAGTVWWNFNDITSDGKKVVFETNATNIFTDPNVGGRNVGIAHLKFDESINYVFGGEGADLILGQDGSDQLFGDGGNDKIYGGGGNDVIKGGIGTDTLVGDVGSDTLVGGDGGDVLIGGAGDDIFYGNTASLVGADVDTLSYDAVARPVTFNLGNTAAQNTGGAGTDRAPNASIENVIGGSASDTLTGTSGANGLAGGSGRDALNGLGGSDRIIGGPDGDVIDCGVESSNAVDTVVLQSVNDSPVGATERDVLTNCKPGDLVDVSAVDANSVLSGDQAFIFNSTAARANSLWYLTSGTDIILRGDVNGNTTSDFEILIKNRSAVSTLDLIK